MKYLNKFNEKLMYSNTDEILDLIDLVFAYIKDDGYKTQTNDDTIAISHTLDFYPFKDIKESLLIFLSLLDKKEFQVRNIICYDEAGNEYALQDHEDDYIYTYKYYTVDKLFDAILNCNIDKIYIVLK